MDKAAKYENPVELFEPMPPEAIERQRKDFPLNEPLNPVQRSEAVDWLLSPNGGGVSVRFVEPYNNPEIKNALVESLMLHPWFTPNKDLANRIPLKGTSAHKVGSTTIPLVIQEEHPRKIDVAVKSSRTRKTRISDELKKIEKFRQRDIHTVEPFGIIEINDKEGHASYLMTVLKKNVIPMEKINFEQLKTEHRDRKLKQLTEILSGLGTFVANMHNKGAIHGDLFLRNVGLDVGQDSSEDFILFDLERSTVMGEQKLGVKNNINQDPHQGFSEGFRDFERKAEDDIANLAADIAVKNENLPRNTIFKFLMEPYLNARIPSHGQLSNEAFLAAFNEKFLKRLEKLEKARSMEQILMEAINAAEELEQ